MDVKDVVFSVDVLDTVDIDTALVLVVVTVRVKVGGPKVEVHNWVAVAHVRNFETSLGWFAQGRSSLATNIPASA